jgi:hypothetical protein
MKKLLVLVLIVLVILTTVLFGKLINVVQSDKYHFNQLELISKVKYIIKAAYNIIDIKLRHFRHRSHPKQELLKNKKILLLGASVGQFWFINEYFSFIDNLAVYQFDKAKALKEYLGNKEVKGKPDAVIIKECAAFIPGNTKKFNKEFTNYKNIYKCMVQLVRRNGMIPIIATVCPVDYGGEHLNNILSFNDWLKKYAQDNDLVIMDIENAVRTSINDRRLKKEISQKDGLHLTREAYETYLNPLVVPTILEAFNLG